MSDKEYVKIPRIFAEVSDETAIRFANSISWGLRGKVVGLIINDLLDLIDREGDIVITALIQRVIRGEHIVKGLPNTKGGNG
jgi:hypothetical protein